MKRWYRYLIFCSGLFLYGCLFELNFLDSSHNSLYYTVQKNDTIYEIAQKFHTKMSLIIDANDLDSPYIIHVGQKLYIPLSENQSVHIVSSGENIGMIAKRYHISVKDIARLNQLKSPYVIHPGQKLRLSKAVRLADTSPATIDSGTKHIPASKRQLKKPPKRSGSVFQWPVKGQLIRKFGAYGPDLKNDGINILVKRGTPIHAAENGVVAYAGNDIKAFGNLILIRHAEGWVTAYAHSDRIIVKTGDEVKKNQIIAHAGDTGNVDRPQLHFEIRYRKQALNPLKFLK